MASARLEGTSSWSGLLAHRFLQVMDKAIDVHDRIMRGLLSQYCGFEVKSLVCSS